MAIPPTLFVLQRPFTFLASFKPQRSFLGLTLLNPPPPVVSFMICTALKPKRGDPGENNRTGNSPLY